ncbi:MAG: hypothetical protein Q8P20_08325 [bacterium]|nr:hypothetical protein [bacterium]
MKNLTFLVIFLMISALQLNCGIFPPQSQPEQKLPIDKELSIIGYIINANQDLFLALYDPIDSIHYTSYKIQPDSIICVIDGEIQTPTLKINEIYVLRVEDRYNRYQEHHKDDSQSKTQGYREPSITISYYESFSIFRFTFTSMEQFESCLPQKLRKKADLKITNPPKPKPGDNEVRLT